MKKDKTKKISKYDGLKVSFGMAATDAVPVIFFCISSFLLANAVGNVTFTIGLMLMAFAGLGKVVWKFIMAASGKNVEFLANQFVYLMSVGFVCALIGYFTGRKNVDLFELHSILTFPATLIFIILGIGGMIAMTVLSVKLDPSDEKANWTEQIVNILSQFAFLVAVIMVWYGMDYYEADENAIKALEGSRTVTVTQNEYGYFFDGPGTGSALVFYPGGKVQYTAYAPLMNKLSENGTDCFLVHMPLNMAFAGINTADKIMEKYDYDKWYVSGHSLGGAMAAVYAAGNTEKLSGLLLLAAYPTKSLVSENDDFVVISLYGSNDKVVQMEKIEDGRTYMPSDYTEICIDGGNHALFGSYGAQSGDGEALITHEAQLNAVVDAFLMATE